VKCGVSRCRGLTLAQAQCLAEITQIIRTTYVLVVLLKMTFWISQSKVATGEVDTCITF